MITDAKVYILSLGTEDPDGRKNLYRKLDFPHTHTGNKQLRAERLCNMA